MNQQRGGHLIRIGIGQQAQLARKLLDQGVLATRLTHYPADLLTQMHRAGKRTKVQPDHGPLQPAPGIGQHLLGFRRFCYVHWRHHALE